jgi:hypothetical protein
VKLKVDEGLTHRHGGGSRGGEVGILFFEGFEAIEAIGEMKTVN